MKLRNVVPLESRFWAKVSITPDIECWYWNGKIDIGGYAKISAGRKSQGELFAHRVSWELHHSPIPDGLKVLHTCDNRQCTNPHHLFLGTNADNSKDMVIKDRQARGERHWFARLTENDVLLLRKMWESGGYLQRELGVMFGVSSEHVRAIIARKVWKYL